MNTFFRTCVYLCFALLLFTLVFNMVDATNAFPTEGTIGPDISDEDSALSELTGLSDPNMNAIWVAVTTLAGLGALALAWLTHSITPIGLWLFGEVFWTSWIRTQSVLNFGSYLPAEFILIFTVGMMFLFIAAIIGMLTGSG